MTTSNQPDTATAERVSALPRLQRDADAVYAERHVIDLRSGDQVFGSLRGSTAKTHAGTFAEYTVAPGSPRSRGNLTR